MNQNTLKRLWTIKEVADFLQVKPSVIKYWIYNSDIPHIKLGKHYRFDPSDVRAWIESNKKEAGTENTLLSRIR